MDLGLKGRVAIIAAASKGLGRSVAEEFAKEGCRVAICARTVDELERTARQQDARQSPVFTAHHLPRNDLAQFVRFNLFPRRCDRHLAPLV